AASLSAQTDADDAAPADTGNGNGSRPAAKAAAANEETTPATPHTVKDGGRTDADTPRATAG
ncbi:hydrogenase, partial [Desulfovibrio sp. XJ01]|nr:hydrogenase [Nitratidesulfovibrio liaohensis]